MLVVFCLAAIALVCVVVQNSTGYEIAGTGAAVVLIIVRISDMVAGEYSDEADAAP